MLSNDLGTVVIVDDDASHRKTLALMLTAMGVKDIVMFDDAHYAIDFIREEKPNLVISDWDMPIMTGIELLIAVRNDSNLLGVPFVLNTGHRDLERWKQAIEFGVTEFIFKPYGFQEFKETILLALDLVKKEALTEEMETRLAS